MLATRSLFLRFTSLLASALLLSACASAPKPVEPPPAVRLAIAQTERGVMIWLPDNVLFDFGKADLNTTESGPYLDRVVQLLKDKTTHNVALEGHTDSVGSAAANKALSEKRATVVRDALLARGLPKERTQVTGLGEEKPIAPNDSELGRKLNRRVELIILGETVENLTRGEPANAFEAAFDKLRDQLEAKLKREPS